MFVDFTTDTVTVVPDTTLLREAGKSLHGNIDREEEGAADPMDSTLRMQVFRTADLGNPEALCVVGRLSERGIGVPRDPVRAGVAYLRAVRLDSYRAPGLLWKLLRSEEFLRTLRIRTDANDPDALFLWAGITALKFSQLLGEDQALRLLERAAEAGHVPSMIELGLCSYTGRWVPQDRARALVWWEKAAAAGSVEGQIRVAIEQILAGPPESELPHITALLDAMAAQGVLIADVARAYCAERGIGRAQDKGEAYRIYHRSMRRGSELAFRALRRMHDDVRPPEEQFRLAD